MSDRITQKYFEDKSKSGSGAATAKEEDNKISKKEIKETVTADTLKPAVVFISGEKEKKVKVPMVKYGETPLNIPAYAEFKDHKYTCTSKHTYHVLKKLCSQTNIVMLDADIKTVKA